MCLLYMACAGGGGKNEKEGIAGKRKVRLVDNTFIGLCVASLCVCLCVCVCAGVYVNFSWLSVIV